MKLAKLDCGKSYLFMTCILQKLEMLFALGQTSFLHINIVNMGNWFERYYIRIFSSFNYLNRIQITGCAKLIFTLFYKIAAIFAILTLQRRVIRRWNGNFVGFTGIFSKIVKNVPVKQHLHFSGKWQKWQIN